MWKNLKELQLRQGLPELNPVMGDNFKLHPESLAEILENDDAIPVDDTDRKNSCSKNSPPHNIFNLFTLISINAGISEISR